METNYRLLRQSLLLTRNEYSLLPKSKSCAVCGILIIFILLGNVTGVYAIDLPNILVTLLQSLVLVSRFEVLVSLSMRHSEIFKF